MKSEDLTKKQHNQAAVENDTDEFGLKDDSLQSFLQDSQITVSADTRYFMGL